MYTKASGPRVLFQDLGRMDYQEAWDLQTQLHADVVSRKRSNRDRCKVGCPLFPVEHHLLFVEHPPVYTLGKSGSIDHLLLNEAQLKEEGIDFYKINRGGDITYHGPGQLVAYPIFDLEEFFTDVHRYVRSLEEVVIRTLEDFGLHAERDEGYTGVWLAGDPDRAIPRRKICAIGVHLSRWTTLHGLALNVCPNLTHFSHIIPCGIQESARTVTSMSVELGRVVDIEEVKPYLRRHFSEVFEY